MATTTTTDQALIDAWNELQAVPSYVEKQAAAFANEGMEIEVVGLEEEKEEKIEIVGLEEDDEESSSTTEMGSRWDGSAWVECPVEDQDPRY